MVTGWTKKQAQQLIELNKQGKSDPQIAKVIGKSRSAVTHKRKRLGIPSILKCNAANRAWTTDEQAALEAMCDQVMPIAVMAQTLGRTEQGIKNRVTRTGAMAGKMRRRNQYAIGLEIEKTKESNRRELRLLIRYFPVYAEKLYRARMNGTALPPELPEWERQNGSG